MTFYICAFSNNQHNLKAEIPDDIEQTPFFKILHAETTKFVVMNVDQSASALLRAWCTLEFMIAHQRGDALKFKLNSRLGPLQGMDTNSSLSRMFLLHMFNILQDMDIEKAEASKQEDLDKIVARAKLFQGRGKHLGYSGTDGLNRIIKQEVADQVLPLLASAGNVSAIKSVS